MPSTPRARVQPSRFAPGDVPPSLPPAAQGRAPLIGSALSDLAHAIDSLEQVASALAERLSPVLGVHLTGSGNQDSAPRPILPPLGEALAGNAERVRVVESAIVDLLDRLEI